MNQCLLNGMYTRQLCYLFYFMVRKLKSLSLRQLTTFHNCCVQAISGITR